MNIVHIALLKIFKLIFHTLHITAKVIDIEHHSEHIVLLIPIRALLPLKIDLFQFFVTLFIKTIQIIAQLRKHRTIAI